jgi:DNA-binding SARP family transcriptional activator
MVVDSTLPRLQDGRASYVPSLRVYLAGDVLIESGGHLMREADLPGPQGRHLLAFLAAEHGRAIGHEELAEELWDGSPPAAWPRSLKALASRIRGAINTAGLDGAALLVGAPGVYRFRLPADGWLDIDAARTATHRAETLLAAGDPHGAARQAFVARLITARPLVPGRTGPWLEQRRCALADTRIRALECVVHARIASGAPEQAARDAQLVVDIAPLREPGWRLLMDAHAAAGDIGSALHAYARCRETLTHALGVGPSQTTRERHTALLAQAG